MALYKVGRYSRSPLAVQTSYFTTETTKPISQGPNLLSLDLGILGPGSRYSI